MEEKMEQKIELQLHEQYAINNNSNLSSMIVLFVGLFAAIGAYGHVFIHTSYIPAGCCMGATSYDLQQFLFTAVGCFIVLAIMMYLCIYQGAAQRYEQFITYAIRQKYHSQYNGATKEQSSDNTAKQAQPIFPKNYHPFDKTCLQFIQGLYGEFIKIIIAVMLLLFIATWYKVHKINVLGCDSCADNCLLLIFSLTIIFITIIILLCSFYYRRDKYKELAKEYSRYNPNQSK